jgi:HicB-like protein involved in pilus formation
MQLNQHMERLRDRLSLVAESEREEEARAAQRLLASLDDSVRLMLLDVLAAAAAEMTRELAPGSVELRLRGSDPEFVVSTPAATAPREPPAADRVPAGAETPGADDTAGGEGAVARINLRLPEQLKARVEQAAEREGLSINAWLVRAVDAVVQRGRSGVAGEPGTSQGSRTYKGWGR